MYHRYELYVGNEKQDIGFLQGLDDTSLPLSTLNELVAAFDDMHIPEDVFKQYRTQSWFTDYGKEYFESAINDIIDAYEQDGLFDVELFERDDLAGENIVYEDDFQVLIEI